MKSTIVLCCFNERSTILQAIEQAKGINMDKEIIIIDNCSTDGTKELLEGVQDDKELQIIFHSKNMGAGYSTQEAISMAGGDYFYAPCADLEYDMNDLYKMIDKMESENLDSVLGSRLLERKVVSKLQLIKERPYWLGTLIATSLINLLYHRRFTDVIGISLNKTVILRKLNCKYSSQAFAFELISKLCKNRYKIGEVALWYKPRTHKEGKTIRAFDMIPAILVMLKVKFFG